MKKVYNIFVPAKGFKAMTIWPFIFVRLEEKRRYGDVDERHESIHGEQQKELMKFALAVLAVLSCLEVISWWWLLTTPLWYFVLYLAEFLLNWILCRDSWKAYRNISFEQEAFAHQDDNDYLCHRIPFAWIKYIG